MKRIFILLFFGLIASCSNKNAEIAKKNNDEGVVFLDKEEFEKASTSFHTALQYKGLNSELEAGILRNLSLLHAMQQAKDSALIYAKKAIEKSKKESYYYYLTRAEHALLTNDVAIAITNFEKAKAIKSEEMAIYNSLGMIYSGKYGQEFENFDKALENNKKAYDISKREPLVDALAISYMNLEQYEKSIPLWDDLIMQNPSKMEYHFQLGVALLFSGKETEGEEKMEFAADRDENCRRMLNEMIVE